MDSITEEGSRLEFARVCIEMDLDKPFLDFIDLVLPDGDKVELKAKYSWRPLRCATCRKFGHRSLKCHLNLAKENLANRKPLGTEKMASWESLQS